MTLREIKGRDHDGEPFYTLADICLINEVLIVDHENRRRANRAAERAAARRRR